MQELFQLFGELGIKTEQAFRSIDTVERRVRDLARQFNTDLTADINMNDNASQGLQDVGNVADNVRLRLEQLENMARAVEAQLEQDIAMNIDVNDTSVRTARTDLASLKREIDRMRRGTEQPIQVQTNINQPGVPNRGNTQVAPAQNVSEAQGQVTTLQNQLRELQSQLSGLNVDDNTSLNFNGLQTNVSGLLTGLGQVENELESIQNRVNNINDSDLSIDATTGQAGTGGSQDSFNNLSSQIAGLQGSIGALALATAAQASGSLLPGGRGRAPVNQGYDMNRVFQQQMRMNQMMLQYSQRMQPVNAVGRTREKIDIGANVIPHLDKAKTQLEMQALMGMMNSSMMTARTQLSQLGFGKTSTEVKALEAQLYTLGNVQLDTLKDNIKLTEKALIDMKKSANADELVDEIARAEVSLGKFKNQLKDADPFKQLGRVNGYDTEKIFGKDVFVKPWKTQIDKVGGMLTQFFNKDVAKLMDKSYKAIDNGAKKIVGSQSTALEQKAKIMQLQTRYQMLGMQLNTFVTPAVLGLAAAFALVGKASEEGFTKFQAQTLTANKDMAEYKNLITDTHVATGASQAEVGSLFSVLHNQMGKTKDNIEEAATMGLYFKKVWGVDAAEAVGTVDGIAKQLGVSGAQAQDILALALKKHQGDIVAATEDVMKNGEAWKKSSKAGTDGAGAYKAMAEGIDNGAFTRFAESFRQMGAALLELWKQLEPSLTKIATNITKAAKATTEWLRENPGMAKFLAHTFAIGGALTVLLGIFAPLAGFLIMHRGLFQAIGQAMGVAGKGAVVLNPAVKMVMDTMKMTGAAIGGLPRIIAGAIPALLGMLRSLPGALAGSVVNFIKMNPLLAAMGALAWVVSKNWERFEPIFAGIWDSVKRIGAAIMGAFAGPGGNAADGFGKTMDNVAKIAGDVLVPMFEILAKVLEVVAVIMENGGGKFVAAGIALWMMGGAMGKVIPMFGMFGGAASKSMKPFGLIFGLFKKLGPLFGMAFAKLGPLMTKIPGLFALVGRGLMALGPLLMNPWAWVILAVVGIGILIYKNWDKIKAGTKKAWNAITGFLKEHGKTMLIAISGPIGWIVAYIHKNWATIKATTKEAWDNVMNYIKLTGKRIKDLASTIFGGLGKFFKLLWAGISGGAKIAWNAIGSFLKGLWRGLRAAAGAIFNGLASVVKRVWNGIRTATRVAWAAIRTIVRVSFTAIKNFIRTTINSIRTTLVTVWGAIKKTVSAIVKGLRDAIITAWRAIKNFVVGAVKAIRNAIVNGFNAAKRIAIAAVRAMRDGVRNAFNAIVERARSFGKTLAKVLRSAWDGLKNMGKTAFGWGTDIVQGLINGIGSMVKKVGKAIGAVATSIKDGITGALKIKSPSRVTDGYGVNVGEGLVNGIRRTIKAVGKASNALSGAIKPPDDIDAKVNVARTIQTNVANAMAPNATKPGGKVSNSGGSVTNNNSTDNSKGVVIQNATFELKIEKLQSSEDVSKLRKVIQNVVANDLYGMAVRRL